MDAIGQFIVHLHQMLGHDKAARFLGQPPGDKAACVICKYEHDPSPENRQAVLVALSPAMA